MPIQKWSRKAVSMNTGVQGASNIAAMTGLAIVVRSVLKSRIACPAAPESVAIICLRIRGAISASIRWLARMSNRLRIMSSTESVSSAKASASVTNSRVVVPPVGTTRSYTCSMYRVGAR